MTPDRLFKAVGASAEDFELRRKAAVSSLEDDLLMDMIADRVKDMQQRLLMTEAPPAPISESLAVQALRAIADCDVQSERHPWRDAVTRCETYSEKQCAAANWTLEQRADEPTPKCCCEAPCQICDATDGATVTITVCVCEELERWRIFAEIVATAHPSDAEKLASGILPLRREDELWPHYYERLAKHIRDQPVGSHVDVKA